MKCLEKDPARRYASAEALADDLRRFRADRPTRARPVTTTERLWLSAKRNPAVAGLVAALAVVLVAAFATVAGLWVKAERTADDERHAKTLAELSHERANREARNAEEALRQTHRQEALLEFDRAVRSCEDGRVADGLLLFLRAAELAERTGQADLARVARVNIAAWPRDLPPTPRRSGTRSSPGPRRSSPTAAWSPPAATPNCTCGTRPPASGRRTGRPGGPTSSRSAAAPRPPTGRSRSARTARPSPPARRTASSPSGTPATRPPGCRSRRRSRTRGRSGSPRTRCSGRTTAGTG